MSSVYPDCSWFEPLLLSFHDRSIELCRNEYGFIHGINLFNKQLLVEMIQLWRQFIIELKEAISIRKAVLARSGNPYKDNSYLFINTDIGYARCILKEYRRQLKFFEKRFDMCDHYILGLCPSEREIIERRNSETYVPVNCDF
jgi:hypothetical protein